LTSITIPDSVTSIGSYAFNNCTGLQYNEYDNALYLGNDNNPYVALIKSKDNLIESVEINENTKIIYSSAFSDCTGLTSITIPDGVTSIRMEAFCNCSGLTSITIPDSVTSIVEYAFSGCTGLTSINFNGTVEQWDAIYKALGWNDTTGDYTVHCTDGDIPKN
ncbi:MAG: leucine-rich repeat domain-containing protein, partial [Clostridia bacterium]|nr:leucine-rich repeat domain-containing protein [Clostridia bacterium]